MEDGVAGWFRSLRGEREGTRLCSGNQDSFYMVVLISPAGYTEPEMFVCVCPSVSLWERGSMYVCACEWQLWAPLCLNFHLCMFKPHVCGIFMLSNFFFLNEQVVEGACCCAKCVNAFSWRWQTVREGEGLCSCCLGTTRSDSCYGHKPINASGSEVQTCPLVLGAKKSI